MFAWHGGGFAWATILVSALALVSGCQGGTPDAKTGGKSRTGATKDHRSQRSADDGYCVDGTCFDCGDGFCMLGWYCDQNMPGGPGCSFVPECGSESNCSCVESALDSACTCEERNGGAYVRCE